MKHKKVILSSIVLLFVAITGLCLYANLAFSNTIFRYGDLNYWLFTDKEFRNFPIIGSEPKAVSYQSSFQDGTKPGMLILTYDTHLNPSEAIKAYQAVCHELNYIPKLTAHAANGILVYSGKGRYEQIEIIVEKNPENGSRIIINFIMKLNN
ncbi:MAG TPA: hypothetical protein VIM29_04970 [Bacillota bacterium]